MAARVAGWSLPDPSLKGHRRQTARKTASPETQIGWLADWLAFPLSLSPLDAEVQGHRGPPSIQPISSSSSSSSYSSSSSSASSSLSLSLSRQGQRPARRVASQLASQPWGSGLAGWLAGFAGRLAYILLHLSGDRRGEASQLGSPPTQRLRLSVWLSGCSLSL